MARIPLSALVAWSALAAACSPDRSGKKDDNQASAPTVVSTDLCTHGMRMESSVACADTVDGPEIEFDATSHDFGVFPSGASLQHSFVLRNAGRAELVIDEILVSCGCTRAVAKETEIPPAGTTEIDVDFDSRMFAGPVRESVRVHSNDPRNPATVLEISAIIELPLDYEPHDVRLTTDSPSERFARVWFVGYYASQCRPTVYGVRGDKAAQGKIAVRPIHEANRGSARRGRHGLELEWKGARQSSGDATVEVTTGLVEPARIVIPFHWGPLVEGRDP